MYVTHTETCVYGIDETSGTSEKRFYSVGEPRESEKERKEAREREFSILSPKQVVTSSTTGNY